MFSGNKDKKESHALKNICCISCKVLLHTYIKCVQTKNIFMFLIDVFPPVSI